MESFAICRKYLAICGIIEPPPSLILHLFNWKTSILLASVIVHLISQAKLLDEANSFEEYTDTIHMVFLECVVIALFTYIVWNAPVLFGLVNSLEINANMSK